MNGNDLGNALANGIYTVICFAVLVGVLVGGGCAFVLTTDWLPSIRLEWKQPAPPASEAYKEGGMG